LLTSKLPEQQPATNQVTAIARKSEKKFSMGKGF